MLPDEQWDRYARLGYLELGRVLDDGQLETLRTRVDDLALGRAHNPHVVFQLDTGGAYDALPDAVGSLEQPTLLYRKVQGLEHDDDFRRLLLHPAFLEICAHEYGPHAPLSIFRAMVMNKPAGQGTVLPWHQDGGQVWALDRDPLVTIWVALDDATPETGCLEIVPGTHRLGLLSWYGSTVADEHVAVHCPPEQVQPLPVPAGHAVVLHNWLIHRSGVNPTGAPRRAFTACFLDGRTRNNLTGELFPVVHGEVVDEPPPYLRQVRDERAFWQHSQQTAEAYAHSLEDEVAKLRAALGAG